MVGTQKMYSINKIMGPQWSAGKVPFLLFHKLMAPKRFEKDIFDLLREISQSNLVVFIIEDDI